jgi:hypothetical protein
MAAHPARRGAGGCRTPGAPMTRLRLLAATLAAAASLAVPAAARASFTVTPSTTQAGAPADVTVHADFAQDPTGGPLVLHLPPGLVGNPRGPGIGACAEAAFRSSSCPANSRVGTAQANGGAASGGIYNLVPQGGEPARLGIEAVPFGLSLLGTAYNEASVSARPDGGLDSRIASLSTTLQQKITSLDLTLNRSFMTLPTSCSPAVTRIEAANNAPQQASFTPTGCASVPYDPALHATIDRRGPAHARSQPALHTSITIPPGQSATRQALVTLPSRLTLDPSAIKSVCTTAQAAADSCPADSAVGSVTAVTPLLATPLTGPVQLVQVPGALFPGLRLALDGPVRLRLTGSLTLTKSITAVFGGLPDVPLSTFDLTFSGGGPLKLLRPACTGVLKLSGQLTGHNGATVTRPATAVVHGCPATAGVALSEGTRPRLRVRVGHGRDAKPLQRAVITLPKGLRARKGAARPSLTRDGKRLPAGAIAVSAHRIRLTLAGARRATLKLGRGALRGRPQGRFAVRLVRTNAKAFTVRAKATRLR